MSFTTPGAYYPASYSLYDQTTEIGTFEVNSAPILGDGSNYAALLTAEAAFRAGVTGVTLGTVIKHEWGGKRTVGLKILPATNLAQRENKLTVVYQDSITGARYKVSVPTAELAVVTFQPQAKDFISITTGAQVIAFVSAFNTFVKSPIPDAPNDVFVVSIKFTGHNN